MRCPMRHAYQRSSYFQDDNLTGTIPPAISLLAFLQILTLRRLPNLVGPIPNSIANLTNLTVLDLSHNSLSGRIPLFVTKLTSLTYLDLSYNQLSSPIPGDLPYLSNLTALHLEHNLLYGNIPNTFGRFPKSSPPDLYLCHNALSGLIWPSLGQPNWGVIDISRNRLTGDASILFGSQKRATRIDISRNRFDFDLSNLSFPLNLRALDFSHNMIHGRIPAQINQVRGLERFNASYNPLCGEIPAGAGSVTARFGQYSYVHHMCLCGAPLTPCN
ncbi:polygalacturonase inhibitor-like [Asparagus officinalis]|uniref:polygalacturonase inhibitor-like n=1 Tax=Asparagus officinalis TaxID=4686 RepID=UPI00098E5FF1|nr:polygalacturonase inhibitor-like [Asparagus officinalis]